MLALEPYFGGSHRQFLERWQQHSRHSFEVLGLAPRQWKWRMRHSAVTFAEQLRRRASTEDHAADKHSWDVVWASDFLPLAEFRGLAPREVAQLPTVLYFHESQLNYPTRYQHPGDLHFAMCNITSALCADAVWFNSAFHRRVFLEESRAFLKRMPKPNLLEEFSGIESRCSVQWPGVDWTVSKEVPATGAKPEEVGDRDPGPLHIVWAARWEHDKDPEAFFRVVGQLASALAAAESRIEFRLSVLGESYRSVPPCFERAREELRDHIAHWGYLETRAEYLEVLAQADVFVSTATHEFFGLSAAEALAAGCAVLLPNRLSYPELVDGDAASLYESEQDLLERLLRCARDPAVVRRSRAGRQAAIRKRFDAASRAAAMDTALLALVAEER